jgi:hypothetical protein
VAGLFEAFANVSTRLKALEVVRVALAALHFLREWFRSPAPPRTAVLRFRLPVLVSTVALRPARIPRRSLRELAPSIQPRAPSAL